MSEVVIYESPSGAVEVRLERDSVWLTQRQLAELLETSTDNIGLHLRNIYAEGELDSTATTEEISVVRQEGRRKVQRRLAHYNLDAVISVGYRVSTTKATRFRQWATGILREHLTQGYTLNRQRLEHNAKELEAALQLVRRAMQAPELSSGDSLGLLDIVTRYAQTYLLLQRYDEGLLAEPPAQAGGKLSSPKEARAALARLKADLMQKGQASELFAQERDDALGALLGNLDQTAFRQPVYPSVESKAAHLLYFVIKNHPFADGNKRSGAFLFVDFLNRNGRLLDAEGQPVINDIGLAALALLVAESPAGNKDTMIRLIMNMLARPSTEGTA